MTQVASRTDFQYLVMFVMGLVVVVSGGSMVSFVMSYMPWVNHVVDSYQEIQTTAMYANVTAMVLSILMYAVAFVGLAVILKHYTPAEPTRPGILTGGGVAGLLMAGLMLASFNAASFVEPAMALSPDASVYTDGLAVVAIGGFYAFAWFVATHLGQTKRRRRA